jgi:hypothetical protein
VITNPVSAKYQHGRRVALACISLPEAAVARMVSPTSLRLRRDHRCGDHRLEARVGPSHTLPLHGLDGIFHDSREVLTAVVDATVNALSCFLPCARNCISPTSLKLHDRHFHQLSHCTIAARIGLKTLKDTGQDEAEDGRQTQGPPVTRLAALLSADSNIAQATKNTNGSAVMIAMR